MSLLSIPGLSHSDQNVLTELVNQLEAKRSRNRVRAQYYDAKYVLRDMGISIPPQMRRTEMVLGWPAKAVDVLARRCNLDGFVIPGGSAEDLGIPAMWRENRMDLEAPQAHTSAFIHSVAFVATTLGDVQSGEPAVLITARDAMSGTGLWDPRRRRLRAALSIVEYLPNSSEPSYFVMYLPDRVLTFTRSASGKWSIDTRRHGLGRVPVEPLVYQPRLGRPFGQSRISRAVMSITDSALRTALRSEVSAEFYSSPQRYLLGADPSAFEDKDGNLKSGWEAIMGRMLTVSRDENDDIPTVGQFQQATMQPHTDQLRSWASLFAGETSLPLSSLGVVQDNPSSAEAIYAAKEELVVEAEYADDSFGAGWTKAVITGIQLRDGLSEVPDELLKLRAKWRDPATPSRAAAADAVTKQVQAGILPPDSEVTYEQLGYDETTIARLVSDKRRAEGRGILDRLTQAANQVTGQEPAEVDGGDAEPTA